MSGQPQKPIALITGTSTGIGLDAARYLIERGWLVFGSVRRPADGEAVRGQLGAAFRPVLFDVTDHEAINRAAGQIGEETGGRPLQALINNAGIAVNGPLESLPMADLRRQMEVNFFGVIAVTQAFIPLLAQPGGRIINMSSVSGQIGFPFFGPYAGSKFALEGISDVLRRELTARGIHVIVIEPGSVETPIWSKGEEVEAIVGRSAPVYSRALHRLAASIQNTVARAMPVERVSETIYRALTSPAPRARYALPNRWLTGWFAPRYLPTRWIDRQITRSLGLIPSDHAD